MIPKELPFRSKLNLAMSCQQLRNLMAAEKFFESFDLSFFHDISEEVLELVECISPSVKMLTIAGPQFDLYFGQTLYQVIMPFRFVNTLRLSHTCVVLSLDFLSMAPVTLRHLQLDFLHMLPAIEFICYVPFVARQLRVLELTNNPQLTKYDLVQILQHFSVLEELNICNTEYITPGTCGTIAQYCYNLECFYFSLDFRVSDTRAWTALLGIDLEHLDFTPEVYRNLNTFYELEKDMDEGAN